FHLRADLTADRAYTLSKASRKIYEEIPEQVRITYYVSNALLDQYPQLRTIEDFLRELADASRSRIAVDFLDPAKGQKEGAVEALGIAPQRMQVVEKNEQRVALVYSGIVVQYLGRTQVIPFVTGTETLEYDLLKSIRAAISDKKPIVALLPGDSDKSLANDYQTLSQALQASRWETRELKPGDAVPAEAQLLIVLGNAGLDDYDVYRIDEYIARGGNALFAVKGVNINTQYGLTAAALEKDSLLVALEAYGIKVARSLVLDQSSQTVPFQDSSAYGNVMVRYVRYPHWIVTRPEYRDPKNPVTARMAGLDLYWPSPLELVPRAGVEESALIKSTPKAWLQTKSFAIAPNEEAMYAAEADSSRGQYTLAASLAGVIPQAFAGKASPVREGSDPLPALPEKSQGARILVIGSADFATDLMTVSGSTFNASFLADAAEWLASGDELVGVKTRGSRDTRLAKIQDPEARNAVITLAYVINLGLVPALVLVFGLLRSTRRKRLSRAGASPVASAAASAAKIEGGKE
ncbi:MAG: GldG family protein, partial [Spirochaetaceae bacterium]|nr:GldG family protein [Spirochaetaceae bacterium]